MDDAGVLFCPDGSVTSVEPRRTLLFSTLTLMNIDFTQFRYLGESLDVSWVQSYEIVRSVTHVGGMSEIKLLLNESSSTALSFEEARALVAEAFDAPDYRMKACVVETFQELWSLVRLGDSESLGY